MPWKIEDIDLPIDPRGFKKKVIRFQKPVALLNDFPDPKLNQPTRFELEIQGFIWPQSLAKSLDDLAKNAETENIPISVTNDAGIEDNWLSGLYSTSRSSVDRDRPLYYNDNGTEVEVYQYSISFVKFADLGSNQTSEEGGPGGDEDGTGFFDLPDEVGFDSNGDGDIDSSEIFNWLVNILTFGVVK